MTAQNYSQPMNANPTIENQGAAVGVGSDRLFAVFIEQHPLTGEAIPIMKQITEQTTVAELIAWQGRTCYDRHRWKPEFFGVRLITEAR